MTRDEKILVIGCIENEGFGYTFESYSNFNEIKDEEFHKLRNAYLDAQQALSNYIEYEKFLDEIWDADNTVYEED